MTHCFFIFLFNFPERLMIGSVILLHALNVLKHKLMITEVSSFLL